MRATALGAAGAGEGEGLGRIGQEAQPQCSHATGAQDGSKVLMISPCMQWGVGWGAVVWMTGRRAIRTRDPHLSLAAHVRAQLQLEG